MSAGTFVGERTHNKIVRGDGTVISEPIRREEAERIALEMWNEYAGTNSDKLPYNSVVNVSDDDSGTTITVTVRYE